MRQGHIYSNCISAIGDDEGQIEMRDRYRGETRGQRPLHKSSGDGGSRGSDDAEGHKEKQEVRNIVIMIVEELVSG